MENTDLLPLWRDFSEAEVIGAHYIRETFSKIFAKWKYNHEYLLKLCIVLYNKVCFFTSNTQTFKPSKAEEYALVYLNLWKRADRFALDTLTGEEIQYLYKITK